MRELTELSRDIFGGRDPDSILTAHRLPTQRHHRNHTANCSAQVDTHLDVTPLAR